MYEAHLTKADGTQVTIEVDESFTVTGEEAHGPGHHGGSGSGGRHGPDGDATYGGTTSGSSTGFTA